MRFRLRNISRAISNNYLNLSFLWFSEAEEIRGKSREETEGREIEGERAATLSVSHYHYYNFLSSHQCSINSAT